MSISQAIARKPTAQGTQIFNAYDRGGLTMPGASMQEVITIITPALAANTPKTIDLAQIAYPFQLFGVFLKNSPSTTSISIKVTESGTANIDITMTVNGGYVELPYLVLTPDQKLVIQLDGNANGLILFAEQRAVIEKQTVVFE